VRQQLALYRLVVRLAPRAPSTTVEDLHAERREREREEEEVRKSKQGASDSSSPASFVVVFISLVLFPTPDLIISSTTVVVDNNGKNKTNKTNKAKQTKQTSSSPLLFSRSSAHCLTQNVSHSFALRIALVRITLQSITYVNHKVVSHVELVDLLVDTHSDEYSLLLLLLSRNQKRFLVGL
jgi:hypothetical protein